MAAINLKACLVTLLSLEVMVGCAQTIFRGAGRSASLNEKAEDDESAPVEPTTAPSPTVAPTTAPTVTPTVTPPVDPTKIPTEPPLIIIAPTPKPTPTPNKTCSKKISGVLLASDGMLNRNPACGPVGKIDMVTSSTLTFRIPAGTKKLTFHAASMQIAKGSCAEVVLTYTTDPQGPYHYEGLCQRVKPEFEVPLSGGTVLIQNTTPSYETLLMVYCKSPQLQSLGMGKNANGDEVAAMQANVSVDYSYEGSGACQ